MHFNSGYRPECVPLVRRFADVFAGYEAVVTPSASCAAMVRHYHHVVDPAVAVPKVYELCEYLIDVLNVTDVGAHFPHTVTFHATCHSQRLLHIGDRPRRLLEAVDGLDLRPLAHPAECCGFGGTFSVKNPDTSTAMGIDKVADIRGAGGEVHWAADAAQANAIVADIVKAHDGREVVKVKSMATQEIELNNALAAHGIDVWETDLAELIVQLGHDLPSHILVPAIHRNRSEIRDIFVREMGQVGRPAPDGIGDTPAELAEAARLHLREKFLRATVAVSGGNFAVA